MKTNLILFIGLIFLLSIGLGLAKQSVINTNITVIYNPTNCTDICTNSTQNSTNYTTCTRSCVGILTLTGENMLEQIEIRNSTLSRIVFNNVIRDLGNESDITSLSSELVNWRQIQEKYNLCLDSNRNISTKLLMLEQDSGAKQNLTVCDSDRTLLQSQLNEKQSEVSSLSQQVEDTKNSKFTNILIGIAIGFVLFKFVLPKVKGEVEAKDPSSEFPGNPGYR